MDRVVGKPHHDGGVVWIPVRVDGRRFAIGACFPGDWNLCVHTPPTGDYYKGRRLAEAYERDHQDELAPLFAAADAVQKAKASQL
jgi:hypothetical protein